MDSGLGFVQPMFFVGVVEDRNDPRVEGRVRVRAFGIHGSNREIPTEELPWATLIIGNHDVNFTPPPLNAWVFGFFIDGRDAQQPMVLGLIPSQASALVDPERTGWGAVPAEDYDRQAQGSRPRDLGLAPLSKLATGEFLNETYNEALETNRVRDIPIAGGCARGHNSFGNGNIWTTERGEFDSGRISTRASSADEQSIYQGLRERGLSDAAAKAVIANAIAESNLNPGINEIAPLVPGSRGGFGLIQWTGPRRVALEREASRRGVSVSNVDFQLDYIVQELQTSERRSYNNMLRTNDPIEATRIFSDQNLRPGIPTRIFSDQNLRPGIPNMEKRLAEARRLAGIDFESNIPEPLTVDPGLQRAADDVRKTRAEEIRTRIAAIDAQIEADAGSLTANELEALLKEKEELEKELARIEGANPINATEQEPYSGYAAYADADCINSWEEPSSGYGARYPYNRVIETASGHSIEVDDTPGAERIMIWHRDGSYIQLTGSSTTHKNMSDSYQINERNHHVYIGGNNIVTIEGNSHVLVKGDKIEEIEGDYKQIVHGNVMIGGGKRVEINGAVKTDIRSSSLGLESNVENLNVKTSKNIVFESGESINLLSRNIRIGAEENMSVAGGKGLFLQSDGGDLHLKSSGNVFLNPAESLFLRSEGGTVSIQSGAGIRMNADTLSIRSEGVTNISSGEELLIASEGGSVNLSASNNMGLYASNMHLHSTEFNATGDTVSITSAGVLNLGGNDSAHLSADFVHLNGDFVYIDDEVQLANGQAQDADSADVKERIEPAQFDDEATEEETRAQDAERPTPAVSASKGPGVPPDVTIPRPPTIL